MARKPCVNLPICLVRICGEIALSYSACLTNPKTKAMFCLRAAVNVRGRQKSADAT